MERDVNNSGVPSLKQRNRNSATAENEENKDMTGRAARHGGFIELATGSVGETTGPEGGEGGRDRVPHAENRRGECVGRVEEAKTQSEDITTQATTTDIAVIL